MFSGVPSEIFTHIHFDLQRDSSGKKAQYHGTGLGYKPTKTTVGDEMPPPPAIGMSAKVHFLRMSCCMMGEEKEEVYRRRV